MNCDGLSSEIYFIPPKLCDWFREEHLTQQSSVIKSPRILTGYKKLICIFSHSWICRSTGAALHQTSDQSQVPMSPFWAHRISSACSSHAHTIRERAWASHMSIFKTSFHITSTNIPLAKQITWPRPKSLGWGCHAAHSPEKHPEATWQREETGNNNPVYYTHMALNRWVTRAISSSLCCWIQFSCYLQDRGCWLSSSVGLRVPGHVCTLVNFSFRRTSETRQVEQQVGERSMTDDNRGEDKKSRIQPLLTSQVVFGHWLPAMSTNIRKCSLGPRPPWIKGVTESETDEMKWASIYFRPLWSETHSPFVRLLTKLTYGC